jgi:hypothetical protein
MWLQLLSSLHKSSNKQEPHKMSSAAIDTFEYVPSIAGLAALQHAPHQPQTATTKSVDSSS